MPVLIHSTVIVNLGMSENFGEVDFKHLTFPAKMYIDYVRVYQREDVNAVGCSPKSHPTAKYIEKCVSLILVYASF